jgi:alkylation response protein AidB-like acyl-CoA dehydrogenase
MQSTRFAGEIADDAVNIFGGRGLTKTGYVGELSRHRSSSLTIASLDTRML